MSLMSKAPKIVPQRFTAGTTSDRPFFKCDALETVWLAGVVGFELRNPSGLKSV
jgi:hypothetical protein